MIVVVVIDENDAMVGLADVNLNIDDKEEEEAEQCDAEGRREGIYVGATSLYLLFLFRRCSGCRERRRDRAV